MSLLKLSNVTSGYGKKEVIKDISFEVNEGEIVTIIGSNGAGKSTVLKTIYGLNPVWNHGKIFFDGDDITGLQTSELLEKGIVYIGQKNNLFESMSVEENLKTAGYIYSKEVLEDRLESIYETLPQLKEVCFKKATELSGGQRSLATLAMGLLHKPKLFLLDEPSAGLDIKNMNKVFAIINSISENKSISFVIVEHRVHDIETISDRWIGIKLGKKIHDNLTIDDYNLKEIFL